ncbi:hypothetical protein [Streptomyces sp. TR06-5]|uniref:hypothetical protein n=1 Tax=unclassified Streptomyces TaxID=2593676 RepID=UPI00399FA040
MASDQSTRRRSLATAAAAAGVLFGLGFVPSAQASPDDVRAPQAAARRVSAVSTETLRSADPGVIAGPRLSRNPAFDRAPYTLGALGLVGAGGLLAGLSRRPRR